jgi:hypothetical protein
MSDENTAQELRDFMESSRLLEFLSVSISMADHSLENLNQLVSNSSAKTSPIISNVAQGLLDPNHSLSKLPS